MNKRTGSSKKLKRAQIAGGIALAAGAVAAFATSAQAAPALSSTVPLDAPPYAVEDFNYPGAAGIQTDYGVLLKRGDGHIVHEACNSATDQLRISARYLPGDAFEVCFRTSGEHGYLSLELPNVYGVRTDASNNTHLELTSEVGTAEYDIASQTFKAIGRTDDPDHNEYSLVEIRVDD